MKNHFNAQYHIYGQIYSTFGIGASLGSAFYSLIWLAFGIQFVWSIPTWIIGWRNLGKDLKTNGHDYDLDTSTLHFIAQEQERLNISRPQGPVVHYQWSDKAV